MTFPNLTLASRSPTDKLPLSHRLSIVYLTTPVIVWLVGWFKWWIGLPMAVLVTASLGVVLGGNKGEGSSGSWRVLLSSPVLVSLLAALAWMLATPYSGLWQAHGDLNTQWALLLEMSRGGWPTYLTNYLNDPPLLAYYMGLQMIPALVGRWLGPSIMSWAFMLWIVLGIWLLIVVFIRGLSTQRASLIAIAILVFYSGMDALEAVLAFGLEEFLNQIRQGYLVYIPFRNILSRPYYPTHFLWFAPQHLIASGLVSLIILQSRHQLRFKAVCGLVIAIGVFWSPNAIGLLPLAIILVSNKEIRPFLKWPNLLVALPLIILIALHLNNDVPTNFSWLWQHYTDITQMLIDLGLLYLTEFGLLAFILWRIDRYIVKEPAFIVSVAVMIAAPWLIYNGDVSYILTRMTIPVSIVLIYLTSRVVVSRLPELAITAKLIPSDRLAGKGMYTLLIGILAIGGLNPLFTLRRATSYPSNAYETIRTPLAYTVEDYEFVTERSKANVPGFWQQLLREKDLKELSLRDPIISSEYDVHRSDNNSLVYLNRNCIPDSEEGTRFFLHIYQNTGDDLSLVSEQVSYIEDIKWRPIYVWDDEWRPPIDESYPGPYACLLTFNLPDYNISRLVTGQYTPYYGLRWSAEYRFDETLSQNSMSQANKYDFTDNNRNLFYYHLAATTEPLIRSSFQVNLVQLHNDTLIYTKDDCVSEATLEPFFLHIIPIDTADLPAQRRQIGFDNYDFNFYDRGIIFDNKCLIIVSLPDYDIAAIRTGQWYPDDGRVFWQGEASLG